MDKYRFKQLLEASLGNVKPLITESEDCPTGFHFDEELKKCVENVIKPEDEEKVVIDTEKFSEINKELFNQIKDNPEIATHVGLEDHHDEDNFLEDISHKVHTHIDPYSKHVTFEFPGLGKNHNIELDLGLSLAKHYEKDHDEHHSEPLASLKPHNFFDVGIKIPLSKMYKK